MDDTNDSDPDIALEPQNKPSLTNTATDTLSNTASNTATNPTSNTATKIDRKAVAAFAASFPATFAADMREVEAAVTLFLDSRPQEATAHLHAKHGTSLIHTHGFAVISMLRAIMTFDALDIAIATNALRASADFASLLRKEVSLIASFSSFFAAKTAKDSHLKAMTPLQIHAEFIFAEAHLLKALLYILTDPNMVGFLREGLAIRNAYTIFKKCYKSIVSIYNEKGDKGLADHGLDEHALQAAYLGVGTFNLILSTIPTRLLRIFEMIGFGGHRNFGMQCLELGGGWNTHATPSACSLTSLNIDKSNSLAPAKSAKKVYVAVDFFQGKTQKGPGSRFGFLNCRKFMCDLSLLTYHIALASMIQVPGCNLPLARAQLEINLEAHPDSFIYLFFKAKSLQADSDPAGSIPVLERVVHLAKDWRQFAHVSFWDIAMCHVSLGNYEKAAYYYDLLYVENKWSKATYLYLKAICLYSVDPVKNQKDVLDMMQKVPKLCQKVAGKSVPTEKYVARKSRKFIAQGGRLLLPAYEMMYMVNAVLIQWCGFDMMPMARLLECEKEFEAALKNLDEQQTLHGESKLPYPTFTDDLCLARFLRGICHREMILPNRDLLVPESVFAKQKHGVGPEMQKKLKYAIRQLEFIGVQAHNLVLDHWMLPFSRYELGNLYMRLGEYDTSRAEYQAALNGGFTDNEAGVQKHKVSMEQSLHLRAHNALVKLTYIESYTDGGEGTGKHHTDSLSSAENT